MAIWNQFQILEIFLGAITILISIETKKELNTSESSLLKSIPHNLANWMLPNIKQNSKKITLMLCLAQQHLKWVLTLVNLRLYSLEIYRQVPQIMPNVQD